MICVKFKDGSIEEIKKFEIFYRTYHNITYKTIKLDNEKVLIASDKLLYCCSKCSREVNCRFSYDLEKISLKLCSDCRCTHNNLIKYGFSSPMQTEDLKNKIRDSNLEKYGVEHPITLEKIKEKVRKTNLERYGSESPFGSELIRAKIKETNLEKFGFEHAMKNSSVQERVRNKILENSGVDSALKVKSIRSKMREEEKKKFFENMINGDRLKDLVTPNFEMTEFNKVSDRYLWVCNSCNIKFFSHLDNGTTPKCPNCFKSPIKNTSEGEKEVLKFIRENCGSIIIENDRTVLAPLELDIYIPDRNFAIEFNGTYWHSSALKDKWYHQKKVELCYRSDIRLLHIFRWQWEEDRKNIENKIVHYLENLEVAIKSRRPISRLIKNNKEVKKDYEFLIWD